MCIKLQDRGPIFYRGVRLGLNKKPFTMYKFRTLIPDAEKIIGVEILTPKHKLETKIGKLLRDTRLDELPQLFNVLKGDMDFVGPRPERPIIYENICRFIKNYDKRFLVKPGLIGYSQLFTPYNTPKEIRALIDNRFVKLKQHIFLDIGMIFYTIITVLIKAVRRINIYFLKLTIKEWLLGIKDKRTLEREQMRRAKVYILSKVDNKEVYTNEALLLDINDEAFLIKSDKSLPDNIVLFRLETEYRIRHSKRTKKKLAYCTGEVNKRIGKDSSDFLYVVKYKPISPLNFYVVHQYFLHKSIV